MINYSTPDLTIHPPRSIRVRIGGYAHLARLLDKARAVIAGKNAGYHYDCPIDKMLFAFTGVTAEAMFAEIKSGKTDLEILTWLNANTKRQPFEVAAWSSWVEQVGPGSAHKVHLACPIPFLGVRTVSQCGEGPPDPVSYDLVGVLLHMGELGGGHYRALCRRDCHWLLFDDTAVQSLGADPPLGLDREAYGFLLQRVPPSVGPPGSVVRGRGGGARGGGRGRPPPLG